MGIVAFSIGGLNIYWYGLVWSAAIVLGMLLTWLNVRLRQESFAPIVDILFWGLPVGLVFARIAYVIFHWSLYEGQWLEMISFWQGGLSVYGALAGFILTVWLYSYFHGLAGWYWLDIMAPAIVAGLMLSQLGNFIAQTTVGMPMPLNLPNDHTLAEYIEYSYRPSGFENYDYFKPVALYQALVQAGILAMALFLSYRQIKGVIIPRGCIFLFSMLCLAVTRFACGFMYLTVDKAGGLHLGQIICLAAASALLVSLWFCFRRRRQKHRLYV